MAALTAYTPAEVPFPLAGDGAFLRFRVKDILELRKVYGSVHTRRLEMADDFRAVDEFWDILFRRLDHADPIVVMDCLRHGLKFKAAGKIDFDDPPFPIGEACRPLQDALMVARDGKTLTAHLAEAVKASGEAGAPAGNPTPGSEPPTSSNSGFGQD